MKLFSWWKCLLFKFLDFKINWILLISSFLYFDTYSKVSYYHIRKIILQVSNVEGFFLDIFVFFFFCFNLTLLTDSLRKIIVTCGCYMIFLLTLKIFYIWYSIFYLNEPMYVLHPVFIHNLQKPFDLQMIHFLMNNMCDDGELSIWKLQIKKFLE